MSKTLQNIDPSQVREIEVKKGESAVILMRQEGVWRIEGKRADADKAQKALDTLRTSVYEGPISRNPNNFERLGVGDEALRVSINEADKAPIAVRIGKSGSTYSSSYVKIEGNDEVYLANANLSLVFPLIAESWRNTTIVNIDPAALAVITYRTRGATVKTYHKDGEGWKVSKGVSTAPADDAELQTLFDAVHPLKATGFVDSEKGQAAFAQEEAKGTIISFNSVLEADLGEMTFIRKQNVWWVRAKGNDDIYTLSDASVKSLALP